MNFNDEQNNVWKTLFERQMPNINELACKEFIKGLKNLEIRNNEVPTVSDLNPTINSATGWEVVMTEIRYLNHTQWGKYMKARQFPITNFIRNMPELDFTPEPDIFHDAFGHLPFMTIPKVVEIIEMFSTAYSNATEDEIVNKISKLWWFSIEFGLIKENGYIKAFGAGLMSSFGEIQKAVKDPEVKRIPFSVDAVLNNTPAVYSMHNEYFVIESLDELKAQLQSFFNHNKHSELI